MYQGEDPLSTWKALGMQVGTFLLCCIGHWTVFISAFMSRFEVSHNYSKVFVPLICLFPVIFGRSESHSSFYRFMFNNANSPENVCYTSCIVGLALMLASFHKLCLSFRLAK